MPPSCSIRVQTIRIPNCWNLVQCFCAHADQYANVLHADEDVVNVAVREALYGKRSQMQIRWSARGLSIIPQDRPSLDRCEVLAQNAQDDVQRRPDPPAALLALKHVRVQETGTGFP